MKKYLVLATLFLITTSAHAANISWNGSTHLRYSRASLDDNLNLSDNRGNSQSQLTNSAWGIRGEIGATGGWDNIEWGTSLATSGSSTAPNEAYQNFDSANSAGGNVNGDLNVRVNRLWFRYGNDWGFGDIGVTIGRQSAAFAVGEGQLFIDKDVDLDGFGWTWRWGSFGLNAGQYILGGINRGTTGVSNITRSDATEIAGSQSTFSVLYAFQPTFKWRFTDEIEAMFAVGYYYWANTTGTAYQNPLLNFENSGFQSTTGQALFDLNSTATVSVENSKQWQFLANVTLPWMLHARGEVIINKDHFYGTPGTVAQASNTIKLGKTAWEAAISYGELKKAQDFMVSYSYSSKGLGAVLTALTNNEYEAGLKGHTISAGYAIANNLHLSGELYILEEINNKNNQGVDNPTEKIDKNYFEIITGITF